VEMRAKVPQRRGLGYAHSCRDAGRLRVRIDCGQDFRYRAFDISCAAIRRVLPDAFDSSVTYAPVDSACSIAGEPATRDSSSEIVKDGPSKCIDG